jgi:hypothetical protein
MSLAAKNGPAKRAVVSISTATDTTVVSGVEGKRIVVVNMVLYIASGQTVVWKSDSTALSGPIGASYTAGDAYDGLIETLLGGDLVITTTAAAVVAGHITYVLMP